MALFDVRCLKCSATTEAFLVTAQDKVPCDCGGVATVVWLKAPGMVPDSFWNPQHDVQLGVTITSRKQRDDLLKERGLVAMGADEHRRTQSQLHAEPEPDHSGAFREAMEKAMSDCLHGRVPKVETPTIDTTDAIIVGEDAA